MLVSEQRDSFPDPDFRRVAAQGLAGGVPKTGRQLSHRQGAGIGQPVQGSVLVRAGLQYLPQQIELAGAEFIGILVVVPVAEEFPAQLQGDAGQ
ncbi:hypothetical protein D3C84_1079480 [compost metagenome]